MINYELIVYAVDQRVGEINQTPETKYNIIATSVLGMNRFTQKDTDYHFDMTHLIGHTVNYTSTVANEEKASSTPFYEVSKVVHDLSVEMKLDLQKTVFNFGRGTIGDATENELTLLLQTQAVSLGTDCFKVIYAKSFGVADTLMALKNLSSRIIGNIDLLILVDGYCNPTARDDILYNDKKFKIPTYVDRAFCIYQTNDDLLGSLEGTKACRPNGGTNGITNYRITQRHIDSYGPPRPRYSHYIEHYSRELTVSHFNMEEITAVIPCCRQDGCLRTIPDVIRIFASKKYNVPVYLHGRGSAHKPTYYFESEGKFACSEFDQ